MTQMFLLCPSLFKSRLICLYSRNVELKSGWSYLTLESLQTVLHTYSKKNEAQMLSHDFHIHCVRLSVNTLRPRQNGRHFSDDSFKCIFLFENVWIWIKISLKFVPKVRINIIPALVQIMAWRRPGDKPLSEPMMVSLLTHICVTRPQWVNVINLLVFCQ